MFTEEERQALRSIARRSIQEGLGTRRHWHPAAEELPDALRRKGASFITLQERGELRGCIGSIEAVIPLADDVADNAFRAAFQDPRFPPVAPAEFSELEISVSVLTPSKRLEVSSHGDLLARLVPGKDGLILECKDGRATYLPDVWKSLPEPHDFVLSLKRKAGLPGSYPTESIQWSVYRTEKV